MWWGCENSGISRNLAPTSVHLTCPSPKPQNTWISYSSNLQFGIWDAKAPTYWNTSLRAEACDFWSSGLLSWPLRLWQVTRPLKVQPSALPPRSNTVLSKHPHPLYFYRPDFPPCPCGESWETNTWWMGACACVFPRVMAAKLAREDKDKIQWFPLFLTLLNPQLWEEYHIEMNALEGKLYNSLPLHFCIKYIKFEHCRIRKHTTYSQLRQLLFTLSRPCSPKLSFFLPDWKDQPKPIPTAQ